MKRLLWVLLLIFITFSAGAARVDYIYNNSISSGSFSIVPQRGEIFSDGNGNIFAVKSANEEVVVFDSIYIKNKVVPDSVLSARNPIIKARACATLKSVGMDFDVILPFVYPLEPFLDFSYDFGKAFSVMSGLKITCPLSNLSASSFTLLKHGSLCGYAAFGLSSKESFGMICGFEYNHIIGSFTWGVGGQMSFSPGDSSALIVPKIALGVFL